MVCFYSPGVFLSNEIAVGIKSRDMDFVQYSDLIFKIKNFEAHLTRYKCAVLVCVF